MKDKTVNDILIDYLEEYYTVKDTLKESVYQGFKKMSVMDHEKYLRKKIKK